jgi:hypothetical protein
VIEWRLQLAIDENSPERFTLGTKTNAANDQTRLLQLALGVSNILHVGLPMGRSVAGG